MANPFTPTFGVTPPLLVGRVQLLADFEEALEDGPGAPARALLVAGTRGSGKTVLLNVYEDLALHHGWAVVPMTARPGLVQELKDERLPRLLYDLGKQDARKLNQIEVNLFGVGGAVGWPEGKAPLGGFRSLLFEVADLAAEQGGGLLITVDEAHRNALDDLRVLTQEVQHAFRQGKNVAFIAAGLPRAVHDLTGDEVLTFLRRAERITLGAVNPLDIEEALQEPATQFGKPFNEEALTLAVEGTGGYPFLIQSVGYESWRTARADSVIGLEAAERGVAAARRRVGHLVHEPALVGLSGVDKSFLAAMSVDDGPSKMSDIANRLGSTPQYANTYRNRLLGYELIASSQHGYVDFTIPYLREYLREHVAGEHFA
ncbi:ATP-binding protein [Rothia nasimurium]|uniref:ATP-binding protein n=1 Tax=Rothia nasimurium TaxID=85336 RepID=A0A4Y9F1U2_9MICC|nr:ATP-binding protein [Rothia nasimurium]TFU21356.1 ATP-binding protein [Rothia nasimurium]